MREPSTRWQLPLVFLLILGLAACGRPPRDDDDTAEDDDDSADDDDTADDDDDSADDDDDSADDDDDSADDDDTVDDDDDATPEPPTFDCSAMPAAAASETLIPGARGYHGLAIDGGGLIVGSDGSSLIQSTYSGAWGVFLPGVGWGQQMAYLPNGDLAMSSDNDGSILRITPSGGSSVIASGVWAYGVIVGPDQMLYTAGSQGVSRIDPVTGAASILISPGSNWEPHSINFNVGFTKLYIGTVEWANQGRVYGVELDANLDPILSTLQVFASGVGEGWHDGVEVDICGYVYIPDYWTSRLYRIHPDGTPEVFVDWSWDTNQYAHGALFGNGVGGFREDALYVPMPYNGNTVKEIVVGVPRRDWAGIALNAP